MLELLISNKEIIAAIISLFTLLVAAFTFFFFTKQTAILKKQTELSNNALELEHYFSLIERIKNSENQANQQILPYRLNSNKDTFKQAMMSFFKHLDFIEDIIRIWDAGVMPPNVHGMIKDGIIKNVAFIYGLPI